MNVKSILSLGLQCVAVFGFAHVVVTSTLAADAPKTATVESAPIAITCSSSVSVMRGGKLVKIASEIHDCSEVSK